MKVVAHRGDVSSAPENSVEALTAAAVAGVDGIEIDLRLSGDGQVILYHDAATPDGRPVRDLTRQDLSQVVGHEVPTLEDALERVECPLWLLDFKTWEAWPTAREILRAHDVDHEFLLMSFVHDGLLEVARSEPWPCGALTAHRPAGDDARYYLQLREQGVLSAIFDMEFLSARIVVDLQSWGMTCHAYNASSAEDHARAQNCGIESVITDFPRRFLEFEGRGGKC